jgi:hypothetical protein
VNFFKYALLFFLPLLAMKSYSAEEKVIGSYLLEYSIFKIDVYQITYINGEEIEKIVLDYKTNVSREISIEGWRVGLKHKLDKDLYLKKAQWIFDHTVDVKKGDRLTILKSSDGVRILKNEQLVGETSDPGISELVFEPWLGERPVDEELKDALLGKK